MRICCLNYAKCKGLQKKGVCECPDKWKYFRIGTGIGIATTLLAIVGGIIAVQRVK